MSRWCELCRDHYDKDHFDQPYVSPVDGEQYKDGRHGQGPEYGPYGILLAKDSAYPILRASLEKIIEKCEDDPRNQEPELVAKLARWTLEITEIDGFS